MSVTQTSGELRIQIETLPPDTGLDIQDVSKTDNNPEPTETHNVPQERMVQTPPGTQGEVLLAIPTSPTTQQQNNQQSITLTYSTQFVSLPLDPPPYSELPVYTIPVPNRNNHAIFDPPPPYDPSMRRETFDPEDFPYQNYRQSRSSRFECKPDTLVPLGFCYCTLEQLIVTLAILGTFLFLGLGQIS